MLSVTASPLLQKLTILLISPLGGTANQHQGKKKSYFLDWQMRANAVLSTFLVNNLESRFIEKYTNR